MVLGLGVVEQIGDRFEGKVLTEMGRLLDGPVLRQSLNEATGKTALAATPDFHAAWQLDPVRKEEGWIIEPAGWSKYEDKGKRGEIWPGWLFGQPLPDLTSPMAEEILEPASPEPIRIVAFVAHSLDEPLPAALHWATVLVNRVKGSGLNIELRLAPASRNEIFNELSSKSDLAIFTATGMSADGSCSMTVRRACRIWSRTSGAVSRGASCLLVTVCVSRRNWNAPSWLLINRYCKARRLDFWRRCWVNGL